MEQQFIHSQQRRIFGGAEFYLTARVSFSPLELDTAIERRVLSSIVYYTIDQRKTESPYVWLYRLLVGSTNEQIIRLADLLAGVTLKTTSASHILHIEILINERLEILNARLIAAANNYCSDLITIGDDYEAKQS